MKKIIKLIIPIFIFLMLVLPVFSLAAGLVPCETNNPDTPLTNHSCEFKDFIDLINNGITFILKFMVVPIAAIMFFYAGFELVTSGGSTEKRETAKKVFSSTVYGLVFAAAAWLIIRTILSILSPEGTWTWIGF